MWQSDLNLIETSMELYCSSMMVGVGEREREGERKKRDLLYLMHNNKQISYQEMKIYIQLKK